MKKLMIFEQAMCCPTGVCGPSVDPELLRVSVIINQLMSSGAHIERHNLKDSPMVFVTNKEVNDLINSQGVEALPITTLNGEVVKTGAYLTDEEMIKYTGVQPQEKKALFSMSGGDDACC